MLKNGQTHYKNLAVFISQDFKSKLDHFSTLCIKCLILECLPENRSDNFFPLRTLISRNKSLQSCIEEN